MQGRPMMRLKEVPWPACLGNAPKAQASRAGGDEPIVTVEAGSHVRPVGSAGACNPRATLHHLHG